MSMPDPQVERAVYRLKQLREVRVRPEREFSLGDALDRARRSVRRRQRQTGQAGGAWQQVCPAELVEGTAVVALHRGVLKIRVEDAATRYVLGRWLRSGGLEAVKAAAGCGIRRVALV